MIDFTYFTPTKVIFGDGVEAEAGAQLKAFGATKVLVHYGSERVVRTGLLGRILDSITAAGLDYVTLGGVVPNPRITKVYEGVALGKKEGVDFILAVGGGSVIDSSKAIGLGLVYDGDVWDFFARKAEPKGCAPVATVLTIPAAGSEMSNGMVVTKEDGGLKRDVCDEACICKFALLNPSLTLTLPASETVNGAVDILMHTMERYFHPMDEFHINDAIAEGLLRSVMESGLILKEEPGNLAARSSIMWASSLSHNGLTGCGSGGEWSTHQIEHEVSGLYDVAHGAGLSTVWPSWARYAWENVPARFVKFAKNVMGITLSGDQKVDALAGIAAMEDYFRSLGSPVTFPELIGRKATEEEIQVMADSGSFFGTRTLGSARTLEKEDIAAILRNAN